MRFLVTGARGFLGSHLVDALAQDAEVATFQGDVRDPGAYEGLSAFDVVYHLAAVSSVPESLRDPLRTWQVNVDGTLRLLEWARSAGVRRVVLVSSAHVYGRPRSSPVDELHPTVPVTPYGASKLAAEAAARAYEGSYGLETVIVRPFNVYGPRQSLGFLIPDILHPLAEDRAPRLGAPDPVRDFTYVSDAVDLLAAAGRVEAARGLALNLGTGVGHSVREVAETAAAVAGGHHSPVFDETRARKAEVPELVVDNALAMRVLAWRPRVDLREGLLRTWESIRQDVSRATQR